MHKRPRDVDRVLGLLAGVALGDGLGAPFEGWSTVPAPALERWVRSSRTLRHTDDTVMTLVLAEHLHRTRGVDRSVLAADFATAWRAEPHRGYGRGAARTLAAIEAGTPWHEATGAQFPDGSWGNGAAMRAAPVAVVAGSVREAAELGRRSAEVTHAHAHGAHGAALQAAATHLVLRSRPGSLLDAEAFLGRLVDVLPSPPWQEKLTRISALLRRGAPAREAADALGNDISALGSVPLAVYVFLRHTDEPEAAFRCAVRCGGDTDTVAAMTGALVGTRCGFARLPVLWAARLEAADRLPELASRLAAAASERIRTSLEGE